jgi:hypothetical protein
LCQTFVSRDFTILDQPNALQCPNDVSSLQSFLQAWRQILKLFDLHRLNEEPLAPDRSLLFGLQREIQREDFIQMYRVTLIGKTSEDVETVLGGMAADIRPCVVGPALFFCELLFASHLDANQHFRAFLNHPLVTNPQPSVKISLSIKSDSGGLVVRPISALEALAAACKSEIRSNVYSSDFARRLQGILDTPFDSLEEYVGQLRKFLSDPENGFTKVVFHVRNLIEVGPSLVDQRDNIKRLNDFVQNLKKIPKCVLQPFQEGVVGRNAGLQDDPNIQTLPTWIPENVLTPLEQGVAGLSAGLEEAVPGSLSAVLKVMLDFFVLPKINALRTIPELDSGLENVSKTIRHMAFIKSLAPNVRILMNIFLESQHHHHHHHHHHHQQQQQQQQHETLDRLLLLLQQKQRNIPGDGDYQRQMELERGQFIDAVSDMKLGSIVSKSRYMAALAKSVLRHITVDQSLTNLETLRRREGADNWLAILHSLTQSVMGGLEEESHATRGELAQTEATAARDQLDLIDSIRQPVQTVRSLIVHGRNLIALLSRPFYPAAVAFGAISSLLLPMTLLALFRGPTALDLNYSFALGLACLAGSATHDVVSGTASKLKSLNDAVFFNMSRSFVLTALIATIAFFVGNFLQKVGRPSRMIIKFSF